MNRNHKNFEKYYQNGSSREVYDYLLYYSLLHIRMPIYQYSSLLVEMNATCGNDKK